MNSLTSYHLKIIAIVSMIIDHTCKIFYQPIQSYLLAYFSYPLSYFLYLSVESLGRIAFILFAFLVANTCYYTHSIQKYIIRLFVFGLISEMPFQYFISIINATPFQPSLALTNVFFTLALGALSILGYRYFSLNSTLQFIPLLLCCLIAYLLNCDYRIFGVILIFSFYYFRDRKQQMISAIFLLFSYYIVYHSIIYKVSLHSTMTMCIYFIYSLLALYFIDHYNSQKGKSIKYIFYIFYPAHMIILCAIYQFYFI